MKYLAIIDRGPTGFRGYAPRLPGCEVYAATEDEAEAAITAAVKKVVSENKPSGNGDGGDNVEVFVVVKAAQPEGDRDECLVQYSKQLSAENELEELEWWMKCDEYEWIPFEIDDLLQRWEDEDARQKGGE